VATVRQWTGREATALRLAKRASVRGFAEELGVAVRTVTDWGRFGAGITPRPDTQAILDTALARCSPQETERFHAEIDQDAAALPRTAPAAAPTLDYEQWSDDLDRAAIAIGCQSFQLASSLIDRWRTRSAAQTRLSERGLYLTARAWVLHGDIRRDQGTLLGPASADRAYATGLEIFTELDIPRRAAQVELSRAVVREMSGALQQSARSYQLLSRDLRLNERDRARARLWVGTALSKLQHNDAAVRIMTDAARRLEELEEPEDWSVAQQKLALAHRGAGRLDEALRLIEVARNSHVDDSPMQQVRLRTAHAHILVSDRATHESGLALLDACEAMAVQYGLSHQQRAIATVRRVAV
jgi:tetratricopeptide (TPR) repeat protein